MTTLIVSFTIAVGLVGVGVAVWSFIDTRKRYFNNYVIRKGSK